MESNVVPLKSSVARAVRGENDFLACSCGDEASGFAPVMMHDAAGAFICKLVCLACEAQFTIANGRVSQ